MMIGNTAIWRRGASVLGATILLAACATTTPPLAEDIATRAQARWDALMSRDIERAYAYLSPGIRSSVSVEQYQRKLMLQKVRWRDADYLDEECENSVCKVRISMDYTVVAAVPGVPRYDGTTTIVEDWIEVDGQWWYVPEK